jgi:hypothetical protein
VSLIEINISCAGLEVGNYTLSRDKWYRAKTKEKEKDMLAWSNVQKKRKRKRFHSLVYLLKGINSASLMEINISCAGLEVRNYTLSRDKFPTNTPHTHHTHHLPSTKGAWVITPY